MVALAASAPLPPKLERTPALALEPVRVTSETSEPRREASIDTVGRRAIARPIAEPAPLPKQKIHPIQICNFSAIGLNVIALVGSLAAGACFKDTSPYLSAGLFGLSGLGGLNAVLGIFDAIYLHTWKPKKTLEQTVDESGALVRDLRKKVSDLQTEKEGLAKLEQDLRVTLQVEKTQDTDLRSIVQGMQTEIGSLIQHEKSLQAALAAAENLKEQWKQIAQRFTQGSASFDTEMTRILSPARVKTSTTIIALHELADSTDRDLEEAQSIAEKMDVARQGWLVMLKDLYQEVLHFKADLETKSRLIEEQKALLEQFSAAIQTLDRNKETLQPSLRQFQALIHDYEVVRAHFTLALSKLEALKNLPDDASITMIRQAANEAIRALQPSL